MPLPILPIKLYTPLPTERYVSRQQLIDRVQTGINSRATIISAPLRLEKRPCFPRLAGTRNTKVAWYSLDEDDNEPVRFFAYIAASLRPLEPDSVPALDALLEVGSATPAN